jgi:hypothetical protein
MAKAYKHQRRQRTQRRLKNQSFMEPSKRPPTAGGDCGSAIKQPRAQQRSGRDTLRNKGLFLLDGGLRGIVQRALNYLRGRKAAMHFKVMHALLAIAVSCSVLPRRPD